MHTSAFKYGLWHNTAMFNHIKEDISIVFERDPAARTRFEILTTYPGVHALICLLYTSCDNITRFQPTFVALKIADNTARLLHD